MQISIMGRSWICATNWGIQSLRDSTQCAKCFFLKTLSKLQTAPIKLKYTCMGHMITHWNILHTAVLTNTINFNVFLHSTLCYYQPIYYSSYMTHTLRVSNITDPRSQSIQNGTNNPHFVATLIKILLSWIFQILKNVLKQINNIFTHFLQSPKFSSLSKIKHLRLIESASKESESKRL